MDRRTAFLSLIGFVIAGPTDRAAARAGTTRGGRAGKIKSRTISSRAYAGLGSRAEVGYKSCAEVRAAGAAPLRREDPGYSRNLDRDNDGIACEVR